MSRSSLEPFEVSESPVVAIRFERVNKEYVSPDGVRKPALVDVNLEVRAGEIFGVIGRSGAGKSTLIRTVNGLEPVSSGDLLVRNSSVPVMTKPELVRLRRRVGMIFQHFNLLSSCTVFDNVALPLRALGVDRTSIELRVKRVLELVGLGDRVNAYPSQLSGGQKQRVGIARALVHEPDILLCDEATSALDPETTQAILELLRDINQRLGLTILLITHEMEVVQQICDRVAVMDHGRIIESGLTWQVFGDPRESTTQALLNSSNKTDFVGALLKRVSRQKAHRKGFALWSVKYDGQTAPPVLTTLNLDSRVDALLVGASVSRLQGRSFGRLILATPVHQDSPPGVLPEIGGAESIQKEFLGYVDSLD